MTKTTTYEGKRRSILQATYGRSRNLRNHEKQNPHLVKDVVIEKDPQIEEKKGSGVVKEAAIQARSSFRGIFSFKDMKKTSSAAS